ncbi:MAG TPA: hypothetical protein VMX18_02695 [Candidatus Bipolaricaulota bacterium]|nr:hypothetical protein [Candidatus Bipolaricaulota bacterium]
MKNLQAKDLEHLLSKNPTQKQNTLILLAAKKLHCAVNTIGYLQTSGRDEEYADTPFFEISRQGKNLLMVGATSQDTSYLGMKLAVNKQITTQYLKKHGLPVPFQIQIKNPKDFEKIFKKHSAIIIKPVASRAGKGVFGNVTNQRQANTAFKIIKKAMPRMQVIAEEQISGNEYRVVVINGKFAAAIYYQPPIVLGDGVSSIKTLIANENASPLRKKGWLHQIKVNKALKINLQSEGLALSSVPEKGIEVVLHRAAPISNGGILIDATDTVGKANIALMEKTAKLIRLNIVGIDVIAPSLKNPIISTNGKIIEVNGGPDLRIHYNVHRGKQRNLSENILRDFFKISAPKKS